MGIFVVAALAIIGGFFALGVLSSTDTAAIEATTTTSTTIEEVSPPVDLENFSVSQIATGDPLQWSRDATYDGLYPLNLAQYGGVLYVAASPSPSWEAEGDGLTVIRSEDGLAWEDLGVVLDGGGAIGMVQSTPHGLVMGETALDGSALRLWLSEDGETWTPHQVPVEPESEYDRAYLTTVGGNDEVLVVAADIGLDVAKLIEDRLGVEVDLTRGYGADRAEDGEVTITVYGPLGTTVLVTTGSELGLTEEQQVSIVSDFESPSQETMQIWALDGTEWRSGVIEGLSWLERIGEGPEGELVAFGYSTSGPAMWSSTDGAEWEKDPTGSNVSWITPWGAEMVGIRDSSPTPEVVVLTGDQTWESTGLGEHFPEQIGWWPASFAAGDGGIALLVQGEPTASITREESNPTVLTDENGAILTIDFNSGVTELDTGADIHKWSMYSGIPPDGIDVGLADQIVVFLDEETGEPLADFSFEELEEAEAAYWLGATANSGVRAFAFSPDASTWTIQDANGLFGADRAVQRLLVTTDRVIAVATPYDNMFRRGGEPGFEIWSAPIP